MVTDSKLKKYLYNSVLIILAVFSAYTLYQSVNSHLQFIKYPYQQEFREGAVLPATGHFVNNENPFDMKYQPQDTYVYGFFYPWLTSHFAKIYGNTLEVHRWISYIFILLTCLLIFLTLNHLKVNPVFSFAAAVILHQSLVSNGLISLARPEGLGIFLFVMGILVPWRFKFSYISCLISIFLAIAGFLTKPYYIFAIPVIMIYLFIFVNKRKAVIYGCISILFIIITLFSVNLVFESYLNNTIFHPGNVAVNDYMHMFRQFMYYFRSNAVLFIIIVISFLIQKVINRKSNTVNENSGNNSANNSFNKPLIKTNSDLLFVFTLIFSLIMFIIKLGGNTGNGGAAYLYHLASPFLVLVTFQIVNNIHSKIFHSAVVLLLIFTLFWHYRVVSYHYENSMVCFEEIKEILKNKNNIYNSSEIVSIMTEQNKELYNNGHSEYFKTGACKLGELTGTTTGVKERQNEFNKNVNSKIMNKEFDLVLLTNNYFSLMLDTALLSKYYFNTDTLCAPMPPNKNWQIQVWYPK